MTKRHHNRGGNNGKIGHPHSLLTTAERFEMKVDRSGECHRWTGARNTAGYGNFYYEGKTRSAHIVALLLAGVEVPEGMTVDHVLARGCVHRDCVRVDHLEVVSQRVNTLRSTNPAALNAGKTHCKRGHEFTEATTIHKRDGRACRVCFNAARREQYAARLDSA